MSLKQRATAASAAAAQQASYQQSAQQQPINGLLDGYAPLDMASAWPAVRAAVGLGIAALVVALVAAGIGSASLVRETSESSNRALRVTLGIASYDSVNNFRTLQEGTEFEIVVDVQVNERMVTLSIPPLQFTSRADYPILDFATLSVVEDNTTEFFVYTVPGTGIPLDLAPKKPLGERFRVQGADDGSSTYSYVIRIDGSLTIEDSDGTPIDVAGGHRIGATVVSYLLPSVDFAPPTNVRLSTGSSNVIGSSIVRNYYDYYANDIKRDLTTGVIRAAFAWSDNSDQGALPRNRLNVWVRAATVNAATGQATYGPAVRVSDARNNSHFGECYVTINPTNVDNLFVICNTRDNNFAPGEVGRNNGTGFASFDGGLTWAEGVAFPPEEQTGDVSAIFDDFGNLYVLGFAGGPDTPFIQVRASVDGGLTFSTTPVVNVTGGDVANGGYIDFPKMSIGPDGSGVAGQLALWFCGDDVFIDTPDIRPLIGYVPVTGLGAFGSQVVIRSFSTIPRTPNGIGLSQIFVNPVTGAVYFVSKNINDWQGPGNPLSEETTSMWVNARGVVDFSAESFSPRRDIVDTTSGINSGLMPTTTFLTTWAPNRGINVNGVRPLGFDASRNRLYYIGVDFRPAQSNDSYVRMVYTENDGQSWSYEYVLNDKRGVVTGFPAISVEHNTGIIAASWYDPRHDLVNQEYVDVYGAIFPAPRARDGAPPAAPAVDPSAKKRKALLSKHKKPEMGASRFQGKGRKLQRGLLSKGVAKVLPAEGHSMTATATTSAPTTAAPLLGKQHQEEECGCSLQGKKARAAKRRLAAAHARQSGRRVLTKAQVREMRARRR